MSKLVSCEGVVKNLNFQKMDTASYTEKMMGFDEEYLRSSSSKILLWQCLEKQMLIQLSFAD